MSVIPTVAADGVGVVSAGQLNAYALSCYNVGVLRTVVGQTGMTAFLQGTNVPNDGGEGTFYWDYASTATDNGTTVIRPYGVIYGAWILSSGSGGSGVASFSAGTTGFTPSTATTSAVVLAGTLNVSNGGTGQTTASAAFNALSPITSTGDLIVGNGTNSATRLGIGANGAVLTSNGTTAVWTVSTGSVTSFSAGTTGFTPSTSTTGAVTLGGTLGIANGGTGITSFGTGVQAALGANTTGTGSIALSNSPTFVTPNLGAANATSVAMTSGTITNAPSSSTDIVNKNYVDNTLNNINYHTAAAWATTADLGTVTYNNGSSGVGATITNAGAQAALVIDGHTFTSTDVSNATRVLVKNESNAAYNGVYTVTNQGSGSTNWVLTRATDFNQPGSGSNYISPGAYVFVVNGSANANTSWVQSTPLPITVGTTSLAFIQVAGTGSYTAGTGLSLSANQFNIANTTVTSGTYGSASTVGTFTVNGQGQLTSATNAIIAIAASQITSGSLGIANGGTGQTTASAAFNALSPITSTGDLIVGNGTNSATKIGIGAADYVLTSNGATASWSATKTQNGTTARTLPNHFSDILNVLDFGATGNGTTDDTTAIQNAINYAESIGASLWFAPGTYLVAGQLTLHNVNLCGPGTFRRNATAANYGKDSAVLWITSTTQVPLLINSSGGVNINGLVFYWPNQNVSTTPIAYPALIGGNTGAQLVDMTISNCVVINAYDFITRDAALTAMGDIRITNCRIYAIHNVFTFNGSNPESIFVDSCIFTPGIFENVAIYANSAYLRNWTANNGTFLYANAGTGSSVDGFSISNSLVFGYGNGVTVASGGMYGFLSTGTSWDNVAQLLRVTGNAYMLGAQFVGGAMWLVRGDGGTSTDSGIYINTTYLIDITFSAVMFNACNGHLFDIENVALGTDPGSAITVTGGYMGSWGRNLNATADVYALYAASANAVITFQPSAAYNDQTRGNGVYLKGALDCLVSGAWWNTNHFVVCDSTFTGKAKLSNIVTVTSVSSNIVLNGATGVVEAGQGCLLDQGNPTYGWPLLYVYDTSGGATTYGAGPTTVTFGGSTPQKIEGLTYSAGVITVPTTGYYRWDVALSHDGTTTTGTEYKLYAQTGGSNVRTFGVIKTEVLTYVDSANLTGSAYFIAGDTLQFIVTRVSGTGSWVTVVDGSLNYLTFTKIA